LYQKTTIKFFNKKDTTTLKIFNMKLQNLFIASALLFATTAINAQDTNEDSHTVTIGIPNVALLDIEGGNITLDVEAPIEAGDAVDFSATNSSTYINYSSIVGEGVERIVTVKITGEVDLPSGLDLLVKATGDEGYGEGTKGDAVAATIVLNSDSQTIIKEIGSAYTGNGVNKGHNLIYSIAQSDDSDSYSNLKFESKTVTITYTLSDN